MSDVSSIVDRFFGGAVAFQTQVLAAIESARMEQGLTHRQLDELCGFGDSERPGRFPTPSSAVLNDNINCVSGLTFNLASCALDLTVDKLNPTKILDEQDRRWLREIISEGNGAVRASGGLALSDVSADDQVEIFLRLSALNELDALVRKKCLVVQ